MDCCQVRLAFLAGLAVVLALIPVNRWLAMRIEAASTEMMGCKDVRVRRTGELLRGIRQIKAAAWEPAFLARVIHISHDHSRANGCVVHSRRGYSGSENSCCCLACLSMKPGMTRAHPSKQQ